MSDVAVARPIDEVAGAAHLAGVLVDVFTPTVQAVHRGVAHRVFSTLGPVAAPIRTLHDAISDVAYTSVRAGAQIVGTLSGIGLGLTARGVDRTPITSNPRGALAVAFFNGLLGDVLDGRAEDLVVRPTLTRLAVSGVRSGVGLTDGSATDRVVVFVHGLAETPVGWTWWSDAAAPYGARLHSHGWTSVDFTYNTGRSVAESGAALASQLADLVASWPVPVSELALIGHSMGGLVVHAACSAGLHDGIQDVPVGAAPELDGAGVGSSWVDQVAHVITLGAPHSGSWLANAAHWCSAVAATRPETLGISTFLEVRSQGIRDLTDVQKLQPNPVHRTGTQAAAGSGCAPVGSDAAESDLAARMPNALHAFVTAAAASPIDSIVGDGLVRRSSASAPATERNNVIVRHHAGVGHIRLLNHHAVGDDLEAWMARRTPSIDSAAIAASADGRSAVG